MRKWFVYSLLLLGVLGVFACKDDDAYTYPPVRLEFITAESGSDGRLQTIVTDRSGRLPIVDDLTHTRIKPDSLTRFISNYEQLPQTQGVRIYAISRVLSVRPLPPTAPNFAHGIKTDPLEVQSIWMGQDYLNVVLLVKGQSFKHFYHFVEESVTTDAETGCKCVKLLLYHDANNDYRAYTRRSYISIPLWQYADETEKGIVIQFRLYTNAGEVETYSFDYLPAKN